jgi:hypothetical protein
MIVLDSATKYLQLLLSGNVTSSQLPFSTSYVDTATPIYLIENDGFTNNGTPVTIVPAPAVSVQRAVKHISVTNADISPATVTIRINDGGTLINVIVVTLAVGDNLIYGEDGHFDVITSAGNIKAGFTGATGPQGIPGNAGPPGVTGEDGVDGVDSLVPGPTGNTGATGSTGPQGLPSNIITFDGDDGLDGVFGIPGPIGPIGPQGPSGSGGGGNGSPGMDGMDGEDSPFLGGIPSDLYFDLFSFLGKPIVSFINVNSTAVAGALNRIKITSSGFSIGLPDNNAVGAVVGIFIDTASTNVVSVTSSLGIEGTGNSRIMWAGETAILIMNGASWTKIGGRSLPMSAGMYNSTTVSVPTATNTLVTLDTVISNNTGLMADTANNRFKIIRTGTYLFIGGMFWCVPGGGHTTVSFNFITYTFDGATQINETAAYCVLGNYPYVGIGFNAPVTAGDFITLYGAQYGGITQAILGYDIFSAIETQFQLLEFPSW